MYDILVICLSINIVTYALARPTDRHRCYALRKANSRKRLLLRGQKADVS